MKILVVGGTGLIGAAVARALEAGGKHQVVRVGHARGDFRVDIASSASIEKLYAEVGEVDAVVSAAGLAKFGPLESLTEEDFRLGLSSKLMGQVDLVRLGLSRIRDGGSFTLTSGVLASRPTPGSSAISIVNAGVEAFVRAAALETPRGVRVNAVSPPWVSETLAAMGKDPSGGLPADRVAKAYVAAVEGTVSGTTIDPK